MEEEEKQAAARTRPKEALAAYPQTGQERRAKEPAVGGTGKHVTPQDSGIQVLLDQGFPLVLLGVHGFEDVWIQMLGLRYLLRSVRIRFLGQGPGRKLIGSVIFGFFFGFFGSPYSKKGINRGVP